MRTSVIKLPVFDTLSLAWKKTNGAKSILFLASIPLIILNAIFIYKKFVFPSFNAESIVLTHSAYTTYGINIVDILLYVPCQIFAFGVQYIGLKRARSEGIEFKQAFRGFHYRFAPKTIMIAIILSLSSYSFVAIDSLLNESTNLSMGAAIAYELTKPFILFLPFYLYIRIMFSPLFILDKNLNLFAAIKSSWLVTRKNFWRIIGACIMFSVLSILSMIPLGIGLIWTLPYKFVLFGEIYLTLLANSPDA